MNSEEQNQVAPKKRGRPRLLNNSVTTKDVIEAIKKTGGRIAEACNLLGISVPQFYLKFRHDPKVEKTITDARKQGFEAVTDVVFSKALEGDMRAIQIYLRYNPLAKEAGWVEKSEMFIKQDKPMTECEKESLVKELFG